MFILFLKAEQQSLLFDTPVMVEGSVRKDGTVVKPHIRIQKKKLADSSLKQASFVEIKPARKSKITSKLETFIAKQDGLHALASKLSMLNEGEQQIIFQKMADLDGNTIKEVAAMFDSLKVEDVKQPDIFTQPTVSGHPSENDLPIVEHITKKGKTLRGVIRKDLTKEEAAEIDHYTFRKEGGWFIREKHLASMRGNQETAQKETVDNSGVSEKQPALNQETANQAKAADSVELDPLEFGVKAGITKSERRKLNARAVAIVTDKTSSDITEEDRAILRQYSGNGGCGDSLNEFYTDPAVAYAMWKVAKKLGITHGTALEPSCFVPETLVKTNDGRKEISLIEIGDVVLSHDGTWNEVTDLVKKKISEQIVSITVSSFFETVTSTKDHEYFAVKVSRCTADKNRYCHIQEQGKCRQLRHCATKTDTHRCGEPWKSYFPEFIKADDLEVGDYLVEPINTIVKEVETVDIDYVRTANLSGPLILDCDVDLLKVVGIYIAEGCVDQNSLVFTFRPDEVDMLDSLKKLFESHGWSVNVKDKGVNKAKDYRIHSRSLVSFFSQFGRGAKNKCLPDWCQTLPTEKQKAILWGIWRGDGSISRDGFIAVDTISQFLALQVRDILYRFGIIPSVRKEKPSRSVINGKGIKDSSRHPIYRVEITGQFLAKASILYGVEHPNLSRKSTPINKTGNIVSGYVFHKIKSIDRRSYSGDVHDITVANSHSYIAGPSAVHNCGAGVFLHTAPEGIKITGVELESISAKIADALHGDRHEIVNASLERFATQDTRRFDIVIGNPPYGPRGMLAKDDKKELSKAEEYFIDTSLDKTRAEGLCILVVPSGILDSKNGRKFRERMLRKAEFLGAQRLPNSAFEASHTDVTTDIIYLRKRPDDIAGAISVLDKKTLQALGVRDDEFFSGTYFEGRGISNIFGEVGTAKRAFGEIYTVNGSMRGVPDLIEQFNPHSQTVTPSMNDILSVLPDQDAKDKALNAAEKRPYQNGAKIGDIKVEDGVTYVLQGDPPRWHRVDEAMQSEAVLQAQVLASEIDSLMAGEVADRPMLEQSIRDWVAKYGIPAKHPELLIAAAQDKTLYRLIGAVGKDGRLSDVVMGKTTRKIEGGFDAVAQSLALTHESGDFTVGELAAALDKDEDDVLDQLTAAHRYTFVEGDRWSTMDTYLTGYLWPKLDLVKSQLASNKLDAVMRSKLENQQKRLEETIDPKSLEDVEIQLNSAFIPLNILEAWIDDKADKLRESNPGSSWYQNLKPASITFENGIYTIGKGTAINENLLDKYLNRTGVRKDDLPTIDDWNEAYKDWLCASKYRDEVEDLYNRKFRGFAHREFTDEPIDVPGLSNQDQLKRYQWPGLKWALSVGKGIIADDVGLGKTVKGLLLARLAKLTSKAQKPVIMVPKSVLANWYVETQKWFPGSKVLTIGGDFSYNDKGELVGRDDNKNERERKYHDLTQNDYDFVIISEPVFQEIDLDPVTKKEMYDTDFWVQRGDSLGNAGDKRVKKIREAYEQSIAKREFDDRTGVIYFNDLGVDMIIADEAHHTKNLYAAKSRFGDNPKFLGGQGLSNRALDFNLKARWLLGQNGGKGVYGLTATPTKNSPLEIYSMLSHIAPEAFENIGIRNSEEFLDRFCKFERDNVLGTNGEIEEALVVAGFKNMDELRTIMNRYVRRTTAEDVGLILPKRDDRMHLIDMTPEQQAVYTELREMAAEAAKKDATGDAHIFSVMDKMNKAALDLEIYDPVIYQGASSPKYEALAKHVAEGIKEGGQVVFADYVDAHDKIVKALVKAGIPKNQIGIINAQVASSAVKRQNIADQFNSGKLKVVIGNTATMGEGINLQKSTTDIHHLDLPWEPASIQQRNGRGLRQGNNKEAVRIHTYLSKGSFDGYRYQSISAKKDWQDLLWKGGDTIENLAREGNISRDEMLIMLSADPEAARAKFDSDKEAALERYEAGERAKASNEFVRFQSLRASYQSLKDKNTTSAALLQSKLEKTRIALKGNRFFTGKSLMDSATNALMEPQTGQVFHANVAFHAVDEKGESEGKFVVTGVNLKVKTVTVRPYADINGRKKIVKLSALNHGITPFAFDADSEAKELAAKMESDAANKANNITDYKQLAELPSRVLHASHDAIQKQLKDGAKSYNITFPSSDIPMVNRENGGIELVKNYSIRNKLDSHDFLLPTDEAKKKLEDAWLNEERNARFGTTFISTGRRGSSSQTHAVKEYQNADYSNKQRNPWSEHIAAANGEKHSYYEDEYGTSTPSIKALRERFKREQIERAKKADTLNETIDHLAPLGVIQDKVKGYGAKVKLPKKALAILWAKARHLGILGDKLIDHLPKHERGYEKHSSYFHGSRKDKSVHAALIGMTRDSGHDDLVAAMVESGLRHHKEADHKEILSDLHQGYGHSDQVLKMMLKLAEASGIADMKAVNADTGIQNVGILRPRQWGGDEHKTIREIIEGRIKNG